LCQSSQHDVSLQEAKAKRCKIKDCPKERQGGKEGYCGKHFTDITKRGRTIDELEREVADAFAQARIDATELTISSIFGRFSTGHCQQSLNRVPLFVQR